MIQCAKLDYNLTVHNGYFKTISKTIKKDVQNTPS
jgi:hypothetical protein